MEQSAGYYGLVKRGDKQFRRSLRTKDRKLAERRLNELRAQVGNLVISEGGTKNHETRTIPMTQALRSHLERLKAEWPPQPSDFVSKIDSAKKCLQTACRRLGCPQLPHHDFRHFFATTCIEAGVDIPTVSRWLGHKDGGALAMRVYGHLMQEHSLAAIKKVQF